MLWIFIENWYALFNFNCSEKEEILLGTEGLVCGTGDTFATKKPDIKCDIVDMEGYAIAKICYNLPMLFTCWKYISDNVDENSPTDFMKNVSKGNKEFNKKLKENIEFYENQY